MPTSIKTRAQTRAKFAATLSKHDVLKKMSMLQTQTTIYTANHLLTNNIAVHGAVHMFHEHKTCA
jgi:hypothetical protein